MAIDDIYQRWRDLVRKNKSGYISNDEFNRQMAAAQAVLSEMYFAMFSRSRRVTDALRPFLKDSDPLQVSGGTMALPSDYRHLVEVFVLKDGKWIRSLECAPNEVGFVSNSLVRGPNIQSGDFRHTVDSTGVRLFGVVGGSAKVSYLRSPKAAVRAVTVDSGNDVENFDANNSVDIEWPTGICHDQLVDLLLWHSGVAVKDPMLSKWMSEKQGFKQTITS